MDKRQIVKLEVFRKCRDFGTKHQAELGASGVQALAALDAVLDGMNAGHIAKLAAAQERLGAKKVVRGDLRSQLEHIELAARTIARTEPGFDNGFRLPERLNDQLTKASARLVIEKAAPVAARLVAFGLPEAFLANLQTTLQRFEAAVATCEGADRDIAAGIAAINDGVKAGMDAVTRLDIIVANAFRNNAPVRAEWNRARQQRAAYRHAATAAASPATVAPPAASQPAVTQPTTPAPAAKSAATPDALPVSAAPQAVLDTAQTAVAHADELGAKDVA